MSQQSKIAFVTGANRGIGFVTSEQLAQKGVHVVMGARDAKAGQEAAKKLKDKNLSVESFVFDVNNPKDHQALATYLKEKFGHLDILVNNAGVMLDPQEGPGNRTSAVPLEALKKTFDTNFFSVVGLTQTLLPLIREAKAGRIVNLSSILGSLGLHSEPGSPIYDSKLFAYNSSKTALNAFTVHLAHELKGTNIKVNSAHPGWVKTDMGGAAAPMELVDGAKTSVQLALLPETGPTGSFFHMDDRLPW